MLRVMFMGMGMLMRRCLRMMGILLIMKRGGVIGWRSLGGIIGQLFLGRGILRGRCIRLRGGRLFNRADRGGCEVRGDDARGEVGGCGTTGVVDGEGVVEEEPAEGGGFTGDGGCDIDETAERFGCTCEVEEDGAGAFVFCGGRSEFQFVRFGVFAV